MSKFEAKQQKLRASRIQAVDRALVVRVSDSDYRVLNYSRFGLGIFTEKPFGTAHEILMAEVFFRAHSLGQYRVLKTREEATEGGYEVGLEILDRPLDMERMEASWVANKTMEWHAQRVAKYATLPPEFRAISRQLLDSLELFRETLVQTLLSVDSELNLKIEKFEDEVVELLAQYLSHYVEQYFAKIAQCIQVLKPEEWVLAMDYLTARFRPLLGFRGRTESTFVSRRVTRDRRQERLFSDALYKILVKKPGEYAQSERSAVVMQQMFSWFAVAKSNKIQVLLTPASSHRDLVEAVRSFPELSDSHLDIFFLDSDRARFQEAHEELLTLGREIISNFRFRFLYFDELHEGKVLVPDSFENIFVFGSSFNVLGLNPDQLLHRLADCLKKDGRMVVFAPNLEGENRIWKYVASGFQPEPFWKDLKIEKALQGLGGRTQKLFDEKSWNKIFCFYKQ